jgi:hypothetical protein
MKQPLEIHKRKIMILGRRIIDRGNCRKVENIKGLLVIVVKGGEIVQ